MKKNELILQFGSFCHLPFFCISLALLPIYFCSYCVGCFSCKWVLETLWHFQRIFVLWKEALIMYINFFLKTNLLDGSKKKSLFSKDKQNAIFKSCTQCRFLDEWFLISAYTHNLLSMSLKLQAKFNRKWGQKRKTSFLQCTWFIILVLL